MRRTLACWSVLAGVFCAMTTHAALTRALAASDEDSRIAADVFLAACRDSPDNLSSVTELARRENWTSLPVAASPERDGMTNEGLWRIDRNGRSYFVSIGTGPGVKTACQVGFGVDRPSRDPFFAAVSRALTLTRVADDTRSIRLEIYRIENLAPKNVILLFVSSPEDGAVVTAAINVN